jgi:hypothetical protein
MNEVNKTKIEDRKRGREAATNIKMLSNYAIKDEVTWFREAFWEELIAAFPNDIGRPLSPAPATEPMSEEEAKAFGQTLIPYGQYKGDKVDSIDLRYLIWLADQTDEFRKELRRYIASKRTQREMG